MGFFQSMSASLVRPDAYPELMQKSTGKCILYLILLVLLFGTPVMIDMSWSYNQEIDTMLAAAEKEVPDFRFANGELSVDADMPVVITGEEQEVIIIDTTGKIKADVLDDYDSGIFISRHQLVSKKNAFQTETMNFKELKDLSFDKSKMLEWLPVLKAFWIFLLLFGLLFMLVGKFLAAVILALLGLLLANLQKHSLTYEESFRLCVHALTGPIIFQACKDIVYPQLPLNGLIYYAIFIVYMWLAIKAVKEQEINPPAV